MAFFADRLVRARLLSTSCCCPSLEEAEGRATDDAAKLPDASELAALGDSVVPALFSDTFSDLASAKKGSHAAAIAHYSPHDKIHRVFEKEHSVHRERVSSANSPF